MNDGSTTRSPSSQAAEAIKKVEIWEQADILSDDEAWEIGSQDASDGARVCQEHLHNNNWAELPQNCLVTRDFNAAQFSHI